MKPMDIEKQSFAIIEKELTTDIPPEYKPVVKRVIHTTADFSYETSMMFSDGVIEKALMAIREGTEIVTDTNMAKSGISHKIAEKFGCSLNCYMADEGVAKEAGGFLHLINSGAACLDANGEAKDENGNAVMKQWWDITEEDQKAIMDNTEWCMADNGYFRGGGYSSRYETKAQMPATMIRLNLVKGLGPVLQIAEGWTVALPAEVSDKLWKRTDYTWPCTWFAPRCDGKEGPFKTAYDVMNNWGANHGAISYGHIGADLITMCSMLRIPVSMHNVPEKDIYRPAAWNAFGMDKEGADFRACKNYGPLYK